MQSPAWAAKRQHTSRPARTLLKANRGMRSDCKVRLLGHAGQPGIASRDFVLAKQAAPKSFQPPLTPGSMIMDV